MKPHLTERELIEYEFKLASDIQAERAAEHLAECRQCREHLEQLKRKFAALDLLREEIKVSDDLISQVVEQTPRLVQPRIVWFRKPVWLGAAAAVLVVALLLLSVPNLTKDVMEEGEFAKGPSEPAEKFRSDLAEETQMVPAEDLAKDVVTKTTFALARKEKEVGKYLERAAIGEAVADVIPEQPPFAPASAIELVVLPRRDKVQLTIYNSADLTLVRERRNLTLKKGWNWLQFMWANTLIDPTSLSLEPLAQADKIDIQQLVFPARLRELGRWLIRSQVSGQVPFEITYFTSGLSWRAFYMGTLTEDEKAMQLQGYVRVGNNSGEDYEKAQTRLIVGKVHILDQIAELARRQHPYGRPGEVIREKYEDENQLRRRAGVIMAGRVFDREEYAIKEIKKEGLSEYFLYTIEGTETIEDKWGKRLLSFNVEDIAIKSLYKYDEERWGNQTIRYISFKNDEEHNLGDTPIPNGNVKIFSQVDKQGYLSYAGGTSIKYIPVDEDVELNLGPARLVKVEPVLMDYKTDNYIVDNNGFICTHGYIYDKKGKLKSFSFGGFDEILTWKIEVTNTRNLPIEIEITRGFETAYWTLHMQAEDVDYEKHDATHARFKLKLEPHSKQSFEYTVTIYHGWRKDEKNR